jgi:hypothetical protein
MKRCCCCNKKLDASNVAVPLYGLHLQTCFMMRPEKRYDELMPARASLFFEGIRRQLL